MAQSFTAVGTGALAKSDDRKRRSVLVTGAAGRIGSYFAEHSRDSYDLRLMVRESDEEIDRIRPFGGVVTADLLDLDRLEEVCQGIDTVVHMAGDPDASATWRELLDANIVGSYNIFVAAKSAGCRRVIHASSIHAVSGYPRDVQVRTSDPVNPGDLYGVSKCFGEAMGRYMAEKEGLSVITLRIGAFQPIEAARKESSFSMMDAFVSDRDLNQLINRCIQVENVQFAILHGLSDNRFKRLDISDARELVGYEPEDDLTSENPRLKPLRLSESVPSHSVVDGQKSGIREEVAPR
ncbi:MAG TPA: NAD(P)-dependent oxidoreductase [Armatimonadota bacterium]|nr:NAD(P)-dependent oxidoreductase [Armatimonadota bacterium]